MVNLVKHDLQFILNQIKIAEAHASGTPLTELVDSPLLPYGLRTVDGSYNNLVPGREKWGAADQPFIRITDPSYLNEADDSFAYVPGNNNNYDTSADVVDADPRLISNLIVDQTNNNPIATQLYERFLKEGLNVSATPLYKEDGTPKLASNGEPLVSYTFDNVSPDIGDSAPYSAMFTMFGQFFDHGLDHVSKGGNGTIYMPLSPDDPLYNPASPRTNFMALTRASTGEDGKNTTTPWVDQNQTYGSHASVQVFLREYVLVNGKPIATGHLLEGSKGGMATWADVKKQAADILGIKLTDLDVGKVPLIAADPYGNFIPGANGFAQLVVGLGPDGQFGTTDDVLVEGNSANPVDPSLVSAFRTGQAFLLDIAHSAVPVVAGGELKQDIDDVAGNAVAMNTRGQNTEYDNELLDAHFIAGDGRANENIGLTAIHHIFHSEHNRVVEHAKKVILSSGDVDFLNEWLLTPVAAVPSTEAAIDALNWNGERLFQAGRFTTEMEYQHLVFEEFARKMQPDVDAFLFEPDPDINPAIFAEFAHVIYRFGHSMLNETVDRVDADGVPRGLTLFDAFLNPIAFNHDGSSTVSSDEAAGAIIRGMSGQVGNEIDEFVTDVLRNQLTGIPLDLAAINIARGRDTGMPTLNEARAQFKAMANGDSQLDPYKSWTDFALNMKNPESIVNFIAAYGTHDLIAKETTIEGKRAAAMAIVFNKPQIIYGDPAVPTDDRLAMVPTDRLDFLNGTGTYAEDLGGLNNVDLWIGGLAEKKMDFGGMLGSTFSFVFELQMENLQDGDRFYYLSRVQGLNLLSELEGNSLAKMVIRNTDIGETGSAVPGDIFSRPDLTLYVDLAKQIRMTGHEDPEHEDATLGALSKLVERRDEDGDGVSEYISYNGGDHTVIQGSDGNDHIVAGKGDDTIWGGAGDDRLEGGYGVDHVHGGAGDDIITNAGTDIGAMDFLHGDEGDDVIHGGSGLSLVFGNQGNDFLIAGPDGKTVMGGIDGDFILGGDGIDVLMGEAGDDWIEGGRDFDTLAGENSELFFNSTIIGHDILNGQQGDTDYDGESGDDIMVQGVGIQRNNGMAGFDWAIHKGDSAAANSDLGIGIFQNQEEFILRDRFDLVEGLSGWKYDDILTGRAVAVGARDEVNGAAAIPAPDAPFYSWSNALTESGVARIAGLRELLSHLSWDRSNPDAIVMQTGDASDILLGGDGNDRFEGKGGNDVIDGDAWLNVRIVVRDGDGREIATADGLTKPLYRTAEGLLAQNSDDLYRTADGKVITLDNAMLEGRFKPGQLGIVREILHADGRDDTDTAIFADSMDKYEISRVGDRVIVARRDDGLIDQQVNEGIDTLINIERIQFSDQVYTIRETRNVDPTGSLAIDGLPAIEGKVLTVSAENVRDGNNPGWTVTGITYRWQVERNAGTGDYIDINGAVGATFTPGNAETGLRIRVIGTYIDAGGVPETVFSTPTEEVISVINDEPTGALLINDMTPTEGQMLTATVAFTDPDGMTNAFRDGTLTYRWQFFDGTAWRNVPNREGGNTWHYTPSSDRVGQILRVNTTYTDDQGYVHTVRSAITGIVGNYIESDARNINANNGDEQGGVTAGDDIVNGGASDNVIAGAGGSDVLNGRAGNDTLYGRAGDDILSGGAGDDTVYGEAGNDIVIYANGDGNDAIDGGAGNDTLRIVQRSEGFDDTIQIHIESGTVTQVGGATVKSVESVELDLGGGNDTLDYNGTLDAIAVDLLKGTASGFSFIRGVENVIGGAGGDTLLGNNEDNRLSGGAGNDTLRGGFGNDTLEGGEGDDWLDGGEGSDTASYAGAAAAVSVSLALAGPQNTGGAGNDTLVSIDNLDGSSYDDRLSGNVGNNRLNGAAGSDTVVLAGTITDHSFAFSLGNTTVTSADGGTDTLTGIERAEVEGSVYNIVAGTNAANAGLIGTDDADLMLGFNGIDKLSAGGGDDVLIGGAGDDVMVGGTGNDTYFVQNAGDVVDETGSDGIDTVFSSINYSLVKAAGVIGDIENLTLIGAAVTGRGNELNNTVTGNGANNNLFGNAGNDHLIGRDGDDTLTGGTGDDWLNGGTGNDTLKGDGGTDTAIFSGLISNYSFTFNGTRLVSVTDTVGNGGTDTLEGIEKLQFSDRMVIIALDGSISPTTPVDPAPVDPAPVDPAPVDPAPVDPAPVDPTPVDPAPVDPAPVDPAPVDPTPVDPAPVDPTPVDPAPVDPTPVDPAPVDPAPVDPAPVDPAPVDPAPVDPAPVNPAPVDPTPVDPAPVNPAPVDPAPVDPAPVKITVDGVTIQETTTNSGGTISRTLIIPVVTDAREEQSGNNTVADIPLVSTSTGQSLLMAEIPTGFGLKVMGSPIPKAAEASMADLAREIKAHTTADLADQLTGGGSGFLSNLSAGAEVLIQTIVLTAAGPSVPAQPLILSGNPFVEGKPHTALVIDASSLPPGSPIELQNVDFAVVLGDVTVTGGAGSQVVWGGSGSQYIVLGADDDILHGGDGDDTVGSEGGNDRIFGGAGSDTVFGGEGNDVIDGGSGTDTVLLVGRDRADYSIRFENGNAVFTHRNGGSDGVDTIANVEMIRFTGPDLRADATLERLYDSILDRAADQAGKSEWLKAHANGMSMHDIAEALIGSAEAGLLHGDMSNEKYVDTLYQSALNRPADQGGLHGWTSALDSGSMDRADVLLSFANSAEKLASSVIEFDFNQSEAATLVRLYDTVFDRRPDQGGINDWLTANENGMSMHDIALGFIGSAEAQMFRGDMNDEEYVDMLYQGALGRSAEAEGRANWVNYLQNGGDRADALLSFTNSAEKMNLIGVVSTSIDTL